MKLLIFIPARKGSKGIKNKNMVLIKKKPLIYYTIKLAKKIYKNSTIFVSTDSVKIKKYVTKFNIKDNYIRPSYLSRDSSNIFDSIIHALSWLKKKNQIYDAVIILQPTSPLRDVSTVSDAIKIFKKKNLNSMMSVSRMKEHPYECIKINKRHWNYLVKNPNGLSQRQQYCDEYYFIDGSFYIVNIDYLIKFKNIINKKVTVPFIQKRNFSIDINDYEDLKIAKIFLNKK
jgi:CMP-N-acetylneuraminic acid synthetase